jgi:hypothetical protein
MACHVEDIQTRCAEQNVRPQSCKWSAIFDCPAIINIENLQKSASQKIPVPMQKNGHPGRMPKREERK